MNPGGMMASHESTKARRSTPVEKRLKFIAPLRNERTIATSEHVDYLGLENIQSWTGKLLPSATSDTSEGEGSASGTANIFYSGDVLFGKLRPYLAKAFHADKDGVCSTELLVLKPRPDIYPRFLFYSMLSLDFVSRVDASTFGAKMPRANWEFIGSMKLPTPNYETQRLIADYLDRETARIDALVAEKEKMLALLEEKRAALISCAVTRGLDPNVPLKPSGLDWLGDIPAHWETRRIRFIAKFIGGSTPATREDAYWNSGNVPWVTPKDMKSRIITDTEDHLTKEGLENCASGLLSPGHLLIVVRSGILRHTLPVSINAVPVALNQDIRAFVLDHQVSADYLAWFIEGKQKPLIDQWCKAVTTVESVEMEYLLDSIIPVPPMSEQVHIAKSISQHIEYIDRTREAIKKSAKLLNERRAALITAAVTGQIPVEEMSP